MNSTFSKIALTGLFICTVFLFQTSAQEPWMQPFEGSANLNFYDIQNSFYSNYHKQYGKYLKSLKRTGKEEEVGEQYGIIQFKRWENFWQPRVNSDGSFPPGNALYNEWKKYQVQTTKISDRSSTPIANWTNLGPVTIPSYTGSGRINVVRFDPNNSAKIFVGTPDGGLWVSADSGNTWATTTDSLPSIGVTDVAIDPTNSNTIYIATGDGDASDSYSVGIMKSINNGITWDTTGLSFTTNNQETISRLLIDPINPNILLAATSKGIERTINGGLTWTKQFVVSNKDMAFMPFHPSTIYAAGTYFYKSVDNGVTWKIAGSGLPSTGVSRIALAVSKADSNFILALVAENTDYGLLGLYESTDAGDTFKLLYNSLNLLGWESNGSDVGGQGWYDLSVAVSQFTTDTIYTGGVDVWRSTNGGKKFSIYGFWAGPYGGPYVHADDHFLTLSPDEKSIYVGCDGGIYQRAFSASKWTDISSGMSIMEIYSLSSSATNSNLITTGAQDNGTCEMNGANNWGLILGGDGMKTIIDYTNPDIIYGEGSYGAINVSVDGGNNFTNIDPNNSASSNWVTPYVMDPNNHNIIYAGLDDIYETSDEGNDWTNITNGLTDGNTYVALAVAPSNSNVIYASTSNAIYRSDNTGTTWSNITNGLPGSLSITSIAVKGSDPYTLWITFSGFNSGMRVYKSIDSGKIWTDVSAGLPAIPVNCINYQNNSNDDLYVGTDLGVYYLNNSLPGWVSYNTGLPNVVIDQLSIQYATSVLRAATYGRGVWQTDLATPTGIPQLIANDNAPGITIYPNPASDYVNIEFLKEYSEPLVISLYNVLGQLEMQKTMESASSDELLQLDISQQARGIHFIKVVSGTEVIAVQKIVVIN